MRVTLSGSRARHELADLLLELGAGLPEPAVAEAVADRAGSRRRHRPGGRRPEAEDVLVAQIEGLAMRVADRVVVPGREPVLAAVARPGGGGAALGGDEAEGLVGDHVGPGQGRPLGRARRAGRTRARRRRSRRSRCRRPAPRRPARSTARSASPAGTAAVRPRARSSAAGGGRSRATHARMPGRSASAGMARGEVERCGARGGEAEAEGERRAARPAPARRPCAG